MSMLDASLKRTTKKRKFIELARKKQFQKKRRTEKKLFTYALKSKINEKSQTAKKKRKIKNMFAIFVLFYARSISGYKFISILHGIVQFVVKAHIDNLTSIKRRCKKHAILLAKTLCVPMV